MNQKSLSTLIASLNLSIVTFFLLPHKSFGVDPNFEACMPKNCGDGQNISFPFWLDGKQKSFCGYPVPGFRLRCRDGHPIFHIPNNDYVVQKILYNEQTIHVYNAAVSSSNTDCFPAIRNVTFERDWFAYGPNVSDLFFLSNCSLPLPLPENLTRYDLDCAAGNGTGWRLAMLGNDRKFSYAVERCNKRVAAPVEVYGDDERNGNENYVEMLRRGFELKWNSSDCGGCERSGGVCGFNETEYHFKCYCPDRPHAVRCNPTISINNKKKLGLILGTGASATGLLIAIVLFCFFRRKYSSRKSMIFWKTKNGNHLDVEGFLKNCRYLGTNRYNYSDVKKMTNSFKEKLGQGGYGGVYKGKLHNGRLVAVKVLSESKGNGEEFINEVASISRTSHVNIVTLLGFCFKGRKRALIYEFMPNGSLEKFIYHEKSSKEHHLGWETLYRIAVGIAQGLEYLHRGCNTRILHFDIKPHNILLDEDFCPKISDFGLAKLCPEKDSIISMLGTRGTAGFIAPEVFCRNFGGVSHKSDVYSYGMMILEMVAGRKNIDVGVDHTSEIYFPHWIYKRLEFNDEIELHDIRNEKDNENARKMTIVGLWCIQTDPSNRPAMSSVVDMLKGSLESLQIPPKPFLSSPLRPPPDSSTT